MAMTIMIAIMAMITVAVLMLMVSMRSMMLLMTMMTHQHWCRNGHWLHRPVLQSHTWFLLRHIATWISPTFEALIHKFTCNPFIRNSIFNSFSIPVIEKIRISTDNDTKRIEPLSEHEMGDLENWISIDKGRKTLVFKYFKCYFSQMKCWFCFNVN